MKQPKINSERWLLQSEYDLKEASRTLAADSFSYAAFFAEQSSQKSLKAYLFSLGKRAIFIHSIGELLKEAAGSDKEFASLLEKGQKLDRYYLASRYPDALPEPAIPAESYGKSEAEEALNTATEIFQLCKRKIL